MGVVVGDADGDASAAGAHGGVHGLLGLGVGGDLEDVGGGEGLDEGAALLGVPDSSKMTVGTLANVGVHCIAEEEELEDGDEEREEEGGGVAEDVGELFAGYGREGCPETDADGGGFEVVAGGIIGAHPSGAADGAARGILWRRGGGQFGRFACGFAPACGSKVWPSARWYKPKAKALGYPMVTAALQLGYLMVGAGRCSWGTRWLALGCGWGTRWLALGCGLEYPDTVGAGLQLGYLMVATALQLGYLMVAPAVWHEMEVPGGRSVLRRDSGGFCWRGGGHFCSAMMW